MRLISLFRVKRGRSQIQSSVLSNIIACPLGYFLTSSKLQGLSKVTRLSQSHCASRSQRRALKSVSLHGQWRQLTAGNHRTQARIPRNSCQIKLHHSICNISLRGLLNWSEWTPSWTLREKAINHMRYKVPILSGRVSAELAWSAGVWAPYTLPNALSSGINGA